MSDADDAALERVRQLCLQLPETTEVSSWGHPNFRAGKVTFVTYEWIRGRPSIAFKLGASAVRQQLKRPGFFLTPYGRGLWVSADLSRRVDWKMIESLIDSSYRLAANQRMLRKLGEAIS